jgi:uncharacterized membrane protein
MVAVLAVSLLLAGGLALDVGLYRMGSRDLRAATEAAALAAAMDPAQAEARARAYLARNGYDPGVLKSVTVGRYCADAALPPDQRFDPSFTRCPGNGLANAVRLTSAKPSRRFLTGALGTRVPIPDMTATATAARIDEAGIEVSSGLLTVSNSLVTSVNDLLGALIGVKLRLNSANIAALMGGNVDAGLFFDALARRSGQTGTYAQLVAGTYGIADIANAAADAAGTPATAAALRTFATQAGNGYRVPLAGLFGLGVWKDMPVGEADAPPALRAGLNGYQLIAYAAQAGPGTIDLSDAVTLLLPGSNNPVVRVAAIASGPLDRPRFAFGPAGETTAGTSALRLQLRLSNIQIALPGILSATVADVPVLIDIAAGSASIAAIDCPATAEQRADTRVTVQARSGLVNAYIGTPPANAMTRPLPPLSAADIGPATLLGVKVLGGLVSIDASARAAVQPVLGQSAALVFGPGGSGTIGGPAAPGGGASIGNGSQTGATLSALGADLGAGLSVDVRLLGACLPLVCNTSAIQSLVLGALLPAITTPLGRLLGTTADPLLDNVLAALGVQLGHATVWVNGARCGVPVLV